MLCRTSHRRMRDRGSMADDQMSIYRRRLSRPFTSNISTTSHHSTTPSCRQPLSSQAREINRHTCVPPSPGRVLYQRAWILVSLSVQLLMLFLICSSCSVSICISKLCFPHSRRYDRTYLMRPSNRNLMFMITMCQSTSSQSGDGEESSSHICYTTRIQVGGWN